MELQWGLFFRLGLHIVRLGQDIGNSSGCVAHWLLWPDRQPLEMHVMQVGVADS